MDWWGVPAESATGTVAGSKTSCIWCRFEELQSLQSEPSYHLLWDTLKNWSVIQRERVPTCYYCIPATIPKYTTATYGLYLQFWSHGCPVSQHHRHRRRCLSQGVQIRRGWGHRGHLQRISSWDPWRLASVPMRVYPPKKGAHVQPFSGLHVCKRYQYRIAQTELVATTTQAISGRMKSICTSLSFNPITPYQFRVYDDVLPLYLTIHIMSVPCSILLLQTNSSPSLWSRASFH